jgi:anti-sigma regulatory factor (Ser/Thr protein kinase)
MAAGPPDRPPDVDLPFGHEPDAPQRARREIRRLVPDPDDPIGEAVVLSASELVTNTLHHTDDGGTLRAWDPHPDVPLRLEVEDHDPTIPTVQANPDPERPGGRGLKLVDDVADEWGVQPTDSGKVVWAEFDRNQRKPDDHTR